MLTLAVIGPPNCVLERGSHALSWEKSRVVVAMEVASSVGSWPLLCSSSTSSSSSSCSSPSVASPPIIRERVAFLSSENARETDAPAPTRQKERAEFLAGELSFLSSAKSLSRLAIVTQSPGVVSLKIATYFLSHLSLSLSLCFCSTLGLSSTDRPTEEPSKLHASFIKLGRRPRRMRLVHTFVGRKVGLNRLMMNGWGASNSWHRNNRATGNSWINLLGLVGHWLELFESDNPSEWQWEFFAVEWENLKPVLHPHLQVCLIQCQVRKAIQHPSVVSVAASPSKINLSPRFWTSLGTPPVSNVPSVESNWKRNVLHGTGRFYARVIFISMYFNIIHFNIQITQGVCAGR